MMKQMLLSLLILAVGFAGCSSRSYALEVERAYSSFVQLHTQYQVNGVWKVAGTYNGFVIAENETAFLILTCGHGPAPAPFGSITYVKAFYDHGKKSPWLVGQTVWYKQKEQTKDWANDIGLVLINKAAFDKGKYPYPSLVQISNTPPRSGSYIYNLGLGGDYTFPTITLTTVQASTDHLFTARPETQGGRSGSPILTDDGYVVGMVLAGNSQIVTAVNGVRIMELLEEYNEWQAKR